jgi:hypothetical protein
MATDQTSRSNTFLGIIVIAAIALLVIFALRHRPTREEQLVGKMQDAQANVEQGSRREWAQLRALRDAKGTPELLPYAILGDGIAGAAAAVNIDSPVRVFGAASFWASLHGVAEVWQTTDSLRPYFKGANLTPPEDNDPAAGAERLLWLAIENSRLEALARPNVRYLLSACKADLEAQPTTAGGADRWRVVHRCEGGYQDVSGPLLLATGVNEARTILSLGLADAATRLALVSQDRLIAADDYLAQSSPRKVSTLVVLGAAGSAADVARYALIEKSVDAVVIKGPPDPIESTPAYELLEDRHGDDICRDHDVATRIQFSGGTIQINGQSDMGCTTLNGRKRKGLKADLLVESLGRERGELPAVLRPAQEAHPVESVTAISVPGGGALIAVRVKLAGVTPPVYLIGGAADLADERFMAGPDRDRYKAARGALLKKISEAGKSENPLPGFAAAAFMGSEFARKCFKTSGAVAFDEAACVAQ